VADRNLSPSASSVSCRVHHRGARVMAYEDRKANTELAEIEQVFADHEESLPRKPSPQIKG
jgi:hypothetical protein